MGTLFYTSIVLLIISTVHSIIAVCPICAEFNGEIPTRKITPRSANTKRTGKRNLDLQRQFLRCFDMNFRYTHDSTSGNETTYEDHEFTKIGRKTFFCDTMPDNMKAIQELKDMLSKEKSAKDVFTAALRYRDEINQNLWLRGFIGSILIKEEGVSPFLPLVEVKPDLMISGRAIVQARAEAEKPADQRSCIVVDKETGIGNGVENELWYFREDLMVNSHHFYWHLEYAQTARAVYPRQGELFYYMHHSMLARYHAERLSNNLSPISPLDIKIDGILEEPYGSFLEDTNSGFDFTERYPNRRFDVQIDGMSSMEPWRKSLSDAAETGFMTDSNGIRYNIKNFEGIDTLARATEPLSNSINLGLYGRWHNSGHAIIASVSDPLTGVRGVMGDTATAMRDVIFYRWHWTVSNLFTKHKETLEPYSPTRGELQLVWPGVFIEDIKVDTVGRPSVPPTNTLYTHWSEKRFDVSRGMDLLRGARPGAAAGSVDVCVEHLDHDEFEYSITVVKSSNLGVDTKATVRIFMAPRYDQNRRRYTMEEQRLLFFVMDTFTVSLNVGRNIITQSSKRNSLTLEYAKGLAQLNSGDPDQSGRCGCGWPHHLLLPKGKPSGMVFDLFVMVTNGEEDAVASGLPESSQTCSQGYLYCGRINDKYPDAKPMGYPFDRKPYTVPDPNGRRSVANIDEYVKAVPNMKTIQVRIFHEQNRKEK